MQILFLSVLLALGVSVNMEAAGRCPHEDDRQKFSYESGRKVSKDTTRDLRIYLGNVYCYPIFVKSLQGVFRDLYDVDGRFIVTEKAKRLLRRGIPALDSALPLEDAKKQRRNWVLKRMRKALNAGDRLRFAFLAYESTYEEIRDWLRTYAQTYVPQEGGLQMTFDCDCEAHLPTVLAGGSIGGHGIPDEEGYETFTLDEHGQWRPNNGQG